MNEQPVAIIINGLAGSARHCGNGVELRGPWASHTGYRRLQVGIAGHGDAGQLYALAEASYEEHRAYAFAVGDEHRDNGWKTLSSGVKGETIVRLPDWHKGVVSQALEAYGMTLYCGFNRQWAFTAACGVNVDTVRQLLAPILRPGTRFADEAMLAYDIDLAARAMGFLPRTPLQQGPAQKALF